MLVLLFVADRVNNHVSSAEGRLLLLCARVLLVATRPCGTGWWNEWLSGLLV